MSDPTSIRPAAPDVEQPQRRAGRMVVVRVDLPEAKKIAPIPVILDSKDAPSGHPDAFVLMHTRDQKIYVRAVYSVVLRARFKEGEKTAYFHAEVFDDSEIEIGERATEAMW